MIERKHENRNSGTTTQGNIKFRLSAVCMAEAPALDSCNRRDYCNLYEHLIYVAFLEPDGYSLCQLP